MFVRQGGHHDGRNGGQSRKNPYHRLHIATHGREGDRHDKRIRKPNESGLQALTLFSGDPCLKSFEIPSKRGAKANYKSSRIFQHFLNRGMLLRRFRQAQSLELLALP